MSKSLVYAGMLLFFLRAYAGYGDMANVENEGAPLGSNGWASIFAWAAIGAVAGYLFCKQKNGRGGKQFAPDGGAVIGLFAGAVMPLVWVFLTK